MPKKPDAEKPDTKPEETPTDAPTSDAGDAAPEAAEREGGPEEDLVETLRGELHRAHERYDRLLSAALGARGGDGEHLDRITLGLEALALATLAPQLRHAGRNASADKALDRAAELLDLTA